MKRPQRSLRVLVALLGSLALIAAACGPSGPTGGGTTPADTPVAGGRVIEGSFADVQRLNPVTSNDAPSTLVSSKIYDTLASYDHKTGEPKPWMAKWTVTSDNLTYTWTIEPNAKWSDGNPVIAADWLARVKMQARATVSPNKSIFNQIEGYQAYAAGTATSISGISIDSADPKKFTVKLTAPYCPALITMFGTAPLPAHIFGKYINDADPKVNVDNAPENNAPPVASGPFKLKEWRRGDQVILTKNETYWRGAPLLDEFVVKVVADTTVAAAQLKTGELTSAIIAPGDVEDLSRAENLNIHRWQDPGYTYIGWKVNHPNVPGLADKRVRQALAYGLDTQAVLKAVFFGEGTQMFAHHAPVSWAAATGLNEYKYDKGRAEQLIQSAGYTKGGDGFYQKDGKTLGWTIVTNQGNKTRETFLQVAAEQYKQIGVKINPKIEAFESLVPKLTSGSNEIESVIIGWQVTPEPDAYTIWHSSSIPTPQRGGNNFVGFSNKRVDELLDQGRGPNCDQAARKRVYQEFNQILNEEQPYNFGISANRLLATDKRIQGIDPGSFSPTGHWNIDKWWIKQ